MAQVQRAEVTFDWTGTVQSKSDRKLQPGQLVELVNVRYTEDGPGPLRKRLGLDKTSVSTFRNGTYAGPATEFQCANDVVFVRDTSDQIWEIDPDTNEGLFRSTLPRVHPTYVTVPSKVPVKACKPITVSHGTETWVIYIGGIGNGSSSSQFGVTVLDTSTGIAKISFTRSTSNTAVFGAASDGTNVWIFRAAATGNTITADKYSSTAGLVSSATYATPSFGASPIITQISARKHSSLSQIVVTAIAYDSAAAPRVNYNYHSYLDASTGAVDGSPAAVTESQNGNASVNDVQCICGLEVASTSGSNGFFYYSFFREKPGATDIIEAVRVKVNATSLATDSKTVLKEYSTGNVSAALGQTCGYFDGTNEVYASSFIAGDMSAVQTTPLEPDSYVERHTYDGASTTSVTLNLAAAVASGWWQEGSNYYLLLGFDDGFTRGAQRSYYVMRNDGYLLSPALYGEASSAFHAGGFSGTYSASVRHRYQANSAHCATVVSVDGNNFSIAVMGAGPSFEDTLPVLVNIDHAAVYHSQAAGIIVGGVPAYFSKKAFPIDLSPVQAPFDDFEVSVNGGATYSTNRIAYRYCYISDDGKRFRSDSSTIQSFTFNDATAPDFDALLPSLRWQSSFGINEVPYIELYGSVNGGTDLYLQQTFKNFVLNNTSPVRVLPLQWTSTGELLDTSAAGALGPSPCPPCRLAITHKNRTWLAGTDRDEVWPSLEHRAGRGPEFNEALVFKWDRGTGHVRAWASVDDDALALFRQDAIALVTGPGPDGLGNGSFDVRTLAGKDGCSNPYACIQGPLGVYFPRHSDGRMCLLTLAGVQEIHQGMEDYTGYTWTGAVDDKAKRELRFYASNGKILRLDYGHPTTDQPWGQWILDEGTSLPAWIGARLINGEPVSLEAGTASIVRTWKPGATFTDDSVSFGKRWTTGFLQPGGMLKEFDVDRVVVSCSQLQAGCTYEIRLTNDQGAVETHTFTTDGAKDFEFRSGVQRTRGVKVTIIETQANGNEGYQFDGIVVEFGIYPGRNQNPRKRLA